MQNNNARLWPEVRLQDIQAPKKWALTGGPFGSNLVQKDYVDQGIPVIRGANLSKDSRFNLNGFVFVTKEKADELLPNNATPGDVIFTQRGTLGDVGYIPKDCKYPRFVISQSQMKLTVDELKADPLWIYYYFRLPSTISRIQNLAFSSGVPHINLSILREFKIHLPPITIQHKIVAILSAYDDLIENTTHRIHILKKIIEEIYSEWFVKFKFPGHENVKIINSELGNLPEGWEVKNFREIFSLEYGKSLPAKIRIPGKYPVYGSSGIVGNHNEYSVKAPGIVVGRAGNAGDVHWASENFFPVDSCFYVKIIDKEVPLHYIYYQLINANLKNLISGAAVPGINRNAIYLLPFIKPLNCVLKEFERIALSIFFLISELNSIILNLRNTRDFLLPKLISGEIDISEIDIKISEVNT